MVIKLSCSEIASIVNALEARIQWMMDEKENPEELVHAKSAVVKLSHLGFELGG